MKTIEPNSAQATAASGDTLANANLPAVPATQSRSSSALTFVGGALLGLLGVVGGAEAAQPLQRTGGNVAQADKDRDGLDRRLTEMEIVHLGQLHTVGPKATPQFREAVVRSQLAVAKEVRYQPSANIILESLTEDLDPKLYELLLKGGPGTDVALARRAFPKGMPKTYEECNEAQRDFIYNYGAVPTMYYLGEVKHVRAAIAPQVNNELAARAQIYGEKKYGDSWVSKIKWDPTLSYLLLYRREVEALKMAEKAVKENPNAVLVIFGAGHSFSYHLDRFPNVTLDEKDLSGRKKEPDQPPSKK